MLAHTHANTDADMQTQTHTHDCANVYTHTHTHTHPPTHTCTQTNTHTPANDSSIETGAKVEVGHQSSGTCCSVHNPILQFIVQRSLVPHRQSKHLQL